jgi:hypothetical protein
LLQNWLRLKLNFRNFAMYEAEKIQGNSMTIFNDLSRCKAPADPQPISLSATDVFGKYRLCAHGQAVAHIKPTAWAHSGVQALNLLG